MKKKKFYVLAIFIYILLMFVGCNKKIIEKSEMKINKGAFYLQSEESYLTYNFDENNLNEKINNENVIIVYNEQSKNYIFLENGEIFVNYKGDNYKIEDENIAHPILSRDGNYLFYFVNSGYLEPIVVDLDQQVKIELKNKSIISGQFIDWISDSELIYYGVDTDERISGIFTYDVTTNEEKLIYKVTGGYVEYLEYVGDGVIFLQETMENMKILKKVTIDDQVEELTNEVSDLKDVIYIDDRLFVLGKMQNNVYSIYEIKDQKSHRIVYDFPTMINVEKGLSGTDSGALLFMGSNDGNKETYIYQYLDGSVSRLFDESGDFNFIKVN